MHPNVKYELLELERLILAGEDHEIDSSSQPLTVEVDRVKKVLAYEVFAFEDERHLERYIQYHQQSIITLLDAFTSSNNSNHDPARHEAIYKNLVDLLSFIERHFVKYFDQDAKAPDAYTKGIRKVFKGHIKRIFRDLTERKADIQLTELILRALNRVTDPPPAATVTYRHIIYAKEVQRELSRFLEKRDENHQDINTTLRTLMYYLNYNSAKVLAYHAHLINTELREVETREEKIERLSLTLKKINQAPMKPGIAYNFRAPSIRSQLANYITEEMDYLERTQPFTGPITYTTHRPPQTMKVRLELSVSQLSYLIKIFIETTIVQNKNITELLRFFARTFTTKKSEMISYDSLRAKFYNVEAGTKSAVRDILVSMVHHIDKDAR